YSHGTQPRRPTAELGSIRVNGRLRRLGDACPHCAAGRAAHTLAVWPTRARSSGRKPHGIPPRDATVFRPAAITATRSRSRGDSKPWGTRSIKRTVTLAPLGPASA